MSYLLTAFGHTVLVAGDGRRGLEIAASQKPELVICDVQLPGMDGLEVARRLHSDPELRSIPIVAVTALASVGDRDRMLAAGFNGYLSKPIDPETFVHRMEAFLPAWLPTLARHAPAAAVASDREVTPQSLTILVVDDNPVNLDLIRSIFVPSGYDVITACGAAEGLALARNIGCQLIVSDVCMSEGSGYDFLLTVRADPKLQEIPFVLLTSTMVDDKDRDHGLALGADRFLRRPIEPETLLVEIREC